MNCPFVVDGYRRSLFRFDRNGNDDIMLFVRGFPTKFADVDKFPIESF